MNEKIEYLNCYYNKCEHEFIKYNYKIINYYEILQRLKKIEFNKINYNDKLFYMLIIQIFMVIMVIYKKWK